MDWTLALGALVVGIVVGLTGMGGGALMTPMLVLLFNVSPLSAVSSDLVAAAVMKPVGSFVHFRHGTVRMDLVKWLCIGSIPAAFCGVLIERALGSGQTVEDFVQYALGVALILAAIGCSSARTSGWPSAPRSATGVARPTRRARRCSTSGRSRRSSSASSAASWSA